MPEQNTNNPQRSPARDQLMVRALRLLAVTVRDHRAWFLWPQIVLFGLCVWFTVE
jgi:hypothetical protein